MPDDSLTTTAAEWTRAVNLDRLQPSRPIAVKLRGKHIALFLHQGEVFACITIVDHGIGLPIFPAHWLKTWSAVRDEVAAGLPAGVRTAMLAAANRLLAVRFKQQHVLRTTARCDTIIAERQSLSCAQRIGESS